MLVLGITNNDLASACLANEKEILASVYEERFTRVKMHKTWPKNSIDYVLGCCNKTLDDIDYITYGWNAGFSADKHLLLYFDRIAEAAIQQPDSLPSLKKRISDEINNDKEKLHEFQDFIKKNSLEMKTIYLDHHECHAIGAFVCSPYDKALVVTCDGRGDFQSLTISLYKNDSVEVLHRETTIDSLGYFYGRITKLLNFSPNRHEGKVTGLAAFGSPDKHLPFMEKMIRISKGNIRANCGDYFQPSYNGYHQELVEYIKNAKPEDIAAAAQKHIELILVQLIDNFVKKYAIKHICLSGGVFGNVKLNQKVQEIDGIESIYVLPCMEDGGLSLAAAVGTVFQKTGARVLVPTMALGPSYTNKECIKAIDRFPRLYVRSLQRDIYQEVVDILNNNKVLGVFRGKMEFGPRALCKRSIIYHARDVLCNDWLNQRMDRTEFMPFAPVVAENLADRCFYGWNKDHMAARFMTVTYDCTVEMKNLCPAVVHVDNTARPQIVRKEDDLFMYELLNYWFAKTGQLCLINTSFNKHEEPIVCTPKDALKALDENIIDTLFFNESIFLCKQENLIESKRNFYKSVNLIKEKELLELM